MITPRGLLLDFGGVISVSLFERHRETEAALGLRAGSLGWLGPIAPETDALWQAMQREEPFGPIALLDVYDTVDEALERANALPYGLAAYAFTNDLQLSHRLAAGLIAGMVGINHFGISQPETPFGGVKDSGLGSESGLEGLLGYTDVKLVSIAS